MGVPGRKRENLKEVLVLSFMEDSSELESSNKIQIMMHLLNSFAFFFHF
jgi:hypothetical protein